jgi:nucleoid-associated protein YgaU
MFNRMLALVGALLLSLATYAVAAELRGDHPNSYVVRKGDTLWDISARFLKQPWLWPEIWQANPQVRNPHLIYPGDVLNLAYLNGEPRIELTRGVSVEPAINTIPLSDVQDFLKKLRVLDTVKDLPYVVGLEEDRLLTANGQLVYARGIPNAQVGDMFAIVRPVVAYGRSHRGSGEFRLRHDDLDFRGNKRHGLNQDNYWQDVMHGTEGQPEYLGTELKELTLAQVTRPQGHGIETTTLLLLGEGVEVHEGDRLAAVETQPFDLQFFPHPPSRQAVTSEYTKFRVIGVPDDIQFAGTHEVIALSGGKVDNIDNGTVFSIWRIGSNKADNVLHKNALGADNDRVKLADEYEGHVMVFRAFDRMSYGLLMDGTKPIQVGDILKHPDATR